MKDSERSEAAAASSGATKSSSPAAAKKVKSAPIKKKAAPTSSSEEDGDVGASKAAASAASTPKRKSKPPKSKSPPGEKIKEALPKLSAKEKKKQSELLAKEKVLLAEKKELERKKDAIERKMVEVKWPVRDEDVYDKLLLQHQVSGSQIKKGKGSKASHTEHNEAVLQKPIPEPLIKIPLENQELASDIITCWDFINTFGKHLELASITLEDFIDLLKFQGEDSIALIEIFTAPLRILVQDEIIANKVSLALPIESHFTYKKTAIQFELEERLKIGCGPGSASLLNMNKGNSSSSLRSGNSSSDNLAQAAAASTSLTINISNIEQAVTQELIQKKREMCKDINVIPRRLRRDVVDPMRWQAVFVAMFPYLPQISSTLRLATEMEHMIEANQQRCSLSSKALSMSLSENSLSTNSSDRIRQRKEEKIQKDLVNAMDDALDPNSEIMRHHVSSLLVQSGISHRKKDINIDSVLCVTDDVTARIPVINDAKKWLHEQDLHRAPLEVKLFLLKVLLESCYEAEMIQQLMSDNAEELTTRMAAMRREANDKLIQKREGSKIVKDRAFELCRAENKISLEAKAAKNAEKLAKAEAAMEKKKAATDEKIAEKAQKAEKAGGKKRKIEESSTSTPTKGGDQDKANPENNSSSGPEPKSMKTDMEKPAKGNKSKKDELDPSANQLSAKIKLLLFYDEIEIDSVKEKDLDLLSDDEDEEQEVEVDGQMIVIGGRQRGAESRNKAAERDEMRKEFQRNQEIVEQVEESLSVACESGRESDLKKAIRNGVRNDLKWTEGEGRSKKYFTTPLMLQAYQMLHELDEKTESDKNESEMQRALNEYTIRTEPLGYDKFRNEYWAFNGDENRLYVKTSGKAKDFFWKPQAQANILPKTNAPVGAEIVLFERDEATKVLCNKRPYKKEGDCVWKIYGSPRDIYYLWAALDDRGINERDLKNKIRSRFDLSEPPTEYQTDHEWVGRKVTHILQKGQKPSTGTIDGWLPEDEEEDDEALWHVKFPDGDEEELDIKEMTKYLVPVEIDPNSIKMEEVEQGQDQEKDKDKDKDKEQEEIDEEERRSSRIIKVDEDKVKNDKIKNEDLMETDSDGEENAPNVVHEYTNAVSYSRYCHKVAKLGSFGILGLQLELSRLNTQIAHGIKGTQVSGSDTGLFDHFTRDVKNRIKKSIEDATSLKEIRIILQEIEEIVFQGQEDIDLSDEKLAKADQKTTLDALLKKGWILQGNPDASSLVGQSARRFFKYIGVSDGIIIGMHKTEIPKTNPVEYYVKYYMEHADGDPDECDEEEANAAVQAFRLGLKAQPVEEDADADDDEDDIDYLYDEDDRELEQMDEDLKQDEDKLWPMAQLDEEAEVSAQLWPSAGVRAKWIAALQNSTIVADVAMCISSFMANCYDFGLMGESEYEKMKEVSPHEIWDRNALNSSKKFASRRGAASQAGEKSNGNGKATRKRGKGKKDMDDRSNKRPGRCGSKVNYNED